MPAPPVWLGILGWPTARASSARAGSGQGPPVRIAFDDGVEPAGACVARRGGRR